MRSNDVAKLAGVTVRTLRHYHQLGLLSEPPRQANGYRDYSPADVARVLRIKRLAGLGFPLSRIGDVLDEMDAEENATSASALDELDRELALEIEHLQEQRRTIAELRAEHLDPDLPVRFARILRMLSGVDTLADARAADRTALIVAGHLYDDEALGELERVVERISSENLVEAMEELGRRLDALTPDAPERERAALAEDSLAALAPVIACFDTANWLRPPTDREQFLDEIAFADYNEAQQDVYGRIERGIEAVMAERAQREKAAAAPSQFCARPCSSVSAWSWSWAPSKASSCRCTSLPRTAPSCSATCCRPCPPACSLARSATRRSPTSCAAAPGTSCRSPAWPWESWGWAFCRRSRCSSRARSCWVFRPAPSRPCSASSSSTAFPPKIEEAPSARRIRSPWPPRPWPCSPPRSSWRAQACPWPPWPSPAAGCSSPCGPSTPTA